MLENTDSSNLIPLEFVKCEPLEDEEDENGDTNESAEMISVKEENEVTVKDEVTDDIGERNQECTENTEEDVNLHTQRIPKFETVFINENITTEEDGTGLQLERCPCGFTQADEESNTSGIRHTCGLGDCKTGKSDIEESFPCRFCDYRAGSERELKLHAPRHTVVMYTCRLCGYQTYNKGHLSKHMVVHTGANPYSCDLCDYKCTNKRKLMKHMSIHSRTESYAVQDSNATQKSNLIEGEPVVKPFWCHFCGFRTARKCNLKMHMTLHTDLKPYACDLCDYRTCNRSHILKHAVVHSGAKPFPCELCDYRATQKSNLINHMLVHTGIKPFACSDCGFQTARKGNLNKHMLVHTNQRRYACDVCDYRTAYKITLARHMLVHKGVKPV